MMESVWNDGDLKEAVIHRFSREPETGTRDSFYGHGRDVINEPTVRKRLNIETNNKGLQLNVYR